MGAAVPVIAALGTAASGIGTLVAGRSARRAADKDRQAQLQAFERQQTSTVQDRVTDAQAAGISPLAAMGVQGTAPLNLSTSRRGGVGNSMQAIGDMVRDFAEFETGRRQAKEERNQRRADRAQRAQESVQKAQTSAIRQQTELARLRLAERKLGLVGPSAIAEHQSGKGPKRMPIFVIGEDNRSGHRLGEGEYWVVHPELAEGLEGVGALGITAGGNVQEFGKAVGDVIRSAPGTTWFDAPAIMADSP